MRRVALFVGMDQYKDKRISKLECAVRDARQMSDVFAEKGYETFFLSNCSSIEVGEKIEEICRTLARGDVFVFYFSGHGHELNEKHYLLCHSANSAVIGINGGRDVIALDEVRLASEDRCEQGIYRFFILDCCRSHILNGARSGLYQAPSARGIELVGLEKNDGYFPPLILRSCAPGQQAFEDNELGHGFFTLSMIEAVSEGIGRNFSSFFSELKKKIGKRISPLEQCPTVSEYSGNCIPLFDGWEQDTDETPVEKGQRDKQIRNYLEIQAKIELLEENAAKKGIFLKEDQTYRLKKRSADLAEKAKEFSCAAEFLNEALAAGEKYLKTAKIQKNEPVKSASEPVVTPGKTVEVTPVSLAAKPKIDGRKVAEKNSATDERRKVLFHNYNTLLLPGELLLELVKINPRSSGNFFLNRPGCDQEFFLGKFPVTQEQYEAVMGTNPSKYKCPNAPVDRVNWEEANLFCQQLNRLYAELLLPGFRFDLPTASQWEFACRAGSTGALNNGRDLTNGYNCPNLDELAWYSANSRGRTHAVGEKKPNLWGLYDMHGNVFEWCRDSSGFSSARYAKTRYIVRGGSWEEPAKSCHASHWQERAFDLRLSSQGFRIALVR